MTNIIDLDTILDTIATENGENGGFEPRRAWLSKVSKENGGLRRFELDWHFSPVWLKKAYYKRRSALSIRKREQGKPRYRG